jgi:hypothetical protein
VDAGRSSVECAGVHACYLCAHRGQGRDYGGKAS